MYIHVQFPNRQINSYIYKLVTLTFKTTNPDDLLSKNGLSISGLVTLTMT